MIDLSSAKPIAALAPKLQRLWEVSGDKIRAVEADLDPELAPVHTVSGTYRARPWTDWTQGFRIGSAILQFDATGDTFFLELGRRATHRHMAPHVSSFGVHDHGFNNISTYGNLLRLMSEGRIEDEPYERAFYELALKVSGAVQAKRWTKTDDELGFVYSFNGPHSLFSDTMRTMRVLGVSHILGHSLRDEGDVQVSLLRRLLTHAKTTAKYNVFYGDDRDGYDEWGRVAHESIFNVTDGQYRCPSTQQGYSPFSTWTRGLAWVMCGFAEQLEFLSVLDEEELEPYGGHRENESIMLRAARAACDFYISNTPTCGVPYWDTGAPGLKFLGDYLDRPADPFNAYEPVDSSAACVAAQGLLRLGRYLASRQEHDAERYWKAGVTALQTLLEEPYLSDDESHHGLTLHSVYHWPRRWDHVPQGSTVAVGEATMWGDYHMRELALYVQRIIRNEPYLAFFEIQRGRLAQTDLATG